MSYYVPPHLRNKRQKTFNIRPQPLNQMLRGGQFTPHSIQRTKNIRFSDMFEYYAKIESKTMKKPSSEKIQPQNNSQPKHYRIELDCGRTRCVALYSKRHDRIFLMGSYGNTTCISINPETHEIKSLRMLPYFKEKKWNSDDLISPQTAWFDASEDNIFILNKTDKASPRVLRYNIQTNRFRDVELFDKLVRQSGYYQDAKAITFEYKNQHMVQLFGEIRMDTWDSSGMYEGIHHNQFIFNDSTKKFTLNKVPFGHNSPDSLHSKSYCVSSNSKQLFQFGWRDFSVKTNVRTEEDEEKNEEPNVENEDLDEEVDEYEQFEVDIMPLEDAQVVKTIVVSDLDYLKWLDGYGFCNINGRYCLFVGGYPRTYIFNDLAYAKDEIYIFDTIDYHWSKSPIKLEKPTRNPSCIWDSKRKIIHIFGGETQHDNSYSKNYMKLKAFEVIPNYMDFDIVKSILWFWFENSKSKNKVHGRWNQDIASMVLSYT